MVKQNLKKNIALWVINHNIICLFFNNYLYLIFSWYKKINSYEYDYKIKSIDEFKFLGNLPEFVDFII